MAKQRENREASTRVKPFLELKEVPFRIVKLSRPIPHSLSLSIYLSFRLKRKNWRPNRRSILPDILRGRKVKLSALGITATAANKIRAGAREEKEEWEIEKKEEKKGERNKVRVALRRQRRMAFDS